MNRFALITLMIPAVLWVQSSHADDSLVAGLAKAADDPAGQVNVQNMGPEDHVGYAVASPFGHWLQIDGRFGSGLGYNGSYYNVRGFFPRHVDPGTSLLFTQINGAVTEDSAGVMNLGAGFGYYSETFNRVLRASGWLDLDDGNRETYYRGGLSFENLGKYCDIRANAYFILDKEYNTVFDQITGAPFFLNNNIGLNRRTIYENAYSGGDVEVGGPLPFLGRHGFDGFAGAYYLGSDRDEDALGYTLRVKADVSDQVNVGVRFNHDDVFGQNTFVSVALQYPSYRNRKMFTRRRVRDKLALAVVRQDRIPVHEDVQDQTELAIDPTDGLPIFVSHVNPNLTFGGNGSYEAAYSSMEMARAANGAHVDILRVMPRANGSDTNLVMNGTFQVNQGQRLLASSFQHTFTSTAGTFLFPGFTPGGMLPHVRNAAIGGSSVFNVLGASEISGFRIDGSNGNGDPVHTGITNVAGSVGFDFNRNTFQNYLNGVVLAQMTGRLVTNNPGYFVSNTLYGTPGTSVAGFSLTNTNTGPLDLGIRQNVAVDHDLDPDPMVPGGVGLLVTADGSQIDMNGSTTSIVGNETRRNGTGMRVTATNAGVVNTIVSGNAFTDSSDISTGFSAISSGAGSLFNMRFIGNELSNNAYTGGRFVGMNGGTLRVTEFTGNRVVDNGRDGVLAMADGGNVEMTVGTTANVVDPNVSNIFSGNGVTILAGPGGINPTDPGAGFGIHVQNGGTFVGSFENNSFNDNFGAGMRVTSDPHLATGTIALGNVFDNSFDRTIRGVDGIEFDTNDANVSANIFRNTFVASSATNSSTRRGIGGEISGGTYDLTIGGTSTATGNIITGSVESGIGLTFSGVFPVTPVPAGSANTNATGTLKVNYNTITGTRDGAVATLPEFKGEAIRVHLEDSATLSTAPSISNNTITDNEYGIRIHAQEAATIVDLLVDSNTIDESVVDGIQYFRRDDARTLNTGGAIRGVTFSNNVITDSGDNGIDIKVQNGDATVQRFDIDNNVIARSGSTGIELKASDDADLDVDMDTNIVDTSGGRGIEYTQSLRGSLTGDWAFNTVSNSTSDGIYAEGNLIPLTIRNSVISTSGGDGIEIFSAGDVIAVANINDNSILDSSLIGLNVEVKDEADLDMDINRNTIDARNVVSGGVLSSGDGMEFTVTGDTDTFATTATLDVTAAFNVVSFHGGRGVDILNRVDADTTFIFDDSAVIGNGLEGIHIVNTSSATQLQGSNADPLLADGRVDADPTLVFRMRRTAVSGNGTTGASTTRGGFVMLVGTSDGGRDETDDGGFASGGRGGIIAEIVDSTFSGNVGDDVILESFVSTIDPATGTTWTDVAYDASGYESDPLARLDLVFTGNTGDVLDATRGGAAYSNADPVFKSRDTAQTDAGPFDVGGARLRNATRLAIRTGFAAPATPGGASDLFRYPGVGGSTFRIETADAGATESSGFGIESSFLAIDALALGALTGELPFEWAYVGVGTFP